ncbi:MAG: GGDEF domain-containing response regulator [Gammaproteobacteria bacterium]
MILKFNFDELKASDRLPSPSGTALAIMKLVQQDDVTVRQVAHLVQSDPALSARALRFVNSAAFGARRPIVSILDAVTRMGVHSVRNFALSLSLVGDHLEGSCRSFDYERYWAESLALAVAIAAITARERTAAPEEAFTLGLLADIGRLALATAWPDSYGECLRTATGKRLLALERDRFDIDHVNLSFLLLSDWGLPEIFLKALKESQERSQVADSRAARFAQQMIFARSIAEYFLADEANKAMLLQDLKQEANRHAINENVLAEFLDAVIDQWREWGSLIDVKTDIRCQSPESTPSDANGLKVLLVDDAPDTLGRIAVSLEAEGYQVEICSDGQTALERLLEHKIQLLITGSQMQPMDGLSLCRSLRSTTFGQKIYIIMLTASENEDDLVEALNAGIDDYVTKPINMRVLLARIQAGKRIVKLQQELSQEHKEIERYSAELALANRRLERIAHTDLLTGLPNRRYAMARLEQEWASAQRFNRSLSVLMIDMDYFKSINDTLGHDAGDVALAHAAGVLERAKRASDIACRLGGEEFLIIAVNTNGASALLLAERIRFNIEKNQPKKLGLPRPITVSIGVAGSNGSRPDWKELMKLADQALYSAKQKGRNQIQLART